jgi:hypothetical protein
VPLEGHWQRQRAPLRRLARRELRLIAAIGTLLVAATVAVVIAAVTTSEPKTKAGCIAVYEPSTMGAVQLHLCHADAARFCRTQATRTDSVARRAQEACRKAGLR